MDTPEWGRIPRSYQVTPVGPFHVRRPADPMEATPGAGAAPRVREPVGPWMVTLTRRVAPRHGNRRAAPVVGRPCRSAVALRSSSRHSRSSSRSSRRHVPAARSPVPIATGPLLTVESRGGECFAAPCGSTIVVERDGRVHSAAKPPNDLGQVPLDQLAVLDAAIKTTDFAILKSRPFTGQCPTAYDGQEFVFEFGAPGGPQRLATCEVEVDYGSPLFVFATAPAPSSRCPSLDPPIPKPDDGYVIRRTTMSMSGRMLPYARSRAKLTQRELAQKSGIPQETIARIERGRVDPRTGTLDRLLEGVRVRAGGRTTTGDRHRPDADPRTPAADALGAAGPGACR